MIKASIQRLGIPLLQPWNNVSEKVIFCGGMFNHHNVIYYF